MTEPVGVQPQGRPDLRGRSRACLGRDSRHGWLASQSTASTRRANRRLSASTAPSDRDRRPDGDEADRASMLQHRRQDGELEFRILADKNDPDGNAKAIIERAMADPSKTKVTDRQGHLLAWWVPVKAGEERSLRRLLLCRNRPPHPQAGEPQDHGNPRPERRLQRDGRLPHERPPQPGPQGRPCVNFNFNTAGGKLFGELTASHLPDKSTGFHLQAGHHPRRRAILRAVDPKHDLRQRRDHRLVYPAGSPGPVERVERGSLPARIRLVKKKVRRRTGGVRVRETAPSNPRCVSRALRHGYSSMTSFSRALARSVAWAS